METPIYNRNVRVPWSNDRSHDIANRFPQRKSSVTHISLDCCMRWRSLYLSSIGESKILRSEVLRV